MNAAAARSDTRVVKKERGPQYRRGLKTKACLWEGTDEDRWGNRREMYMYRGTMMS